MVEPGPQFPSTLDMWRIRQQPLCVGRLPKSVELDHAITVTTVMTSKCIHTASDISGTELEFFFVAS
jgi:hypothetical protein